MRGSSATSAGGKGKGNCIKRKARAVGEKGRKEAGMGDEEGMVASPQIKKEILRKNSVTLSFGVSRIPRSYLCTLKRSRFGRLSDGW
jgi:hypothetical protein